MSTTVSQSAHVPQQQAPSEPGHLDARPPGDDQRGGTRIVQDALHGVLCVLAGVLITVGFALDLGNHADTGTELLAVVVDAPDRFYWANTVGALGLVLVAAVGLAVLRLVRGRGRVAATVGGLLLMIGGAAAAAGQFMYGAVVTAMAQSGEDLAVMAALQDSFEDSVRTGMPFFIGFPGIMLGLLVSAGALLRSRAVPRWVPLAMVHGVVAVVALGDSAASSVADLLLTAAFVGIGLALWRSTAARRDA